MTLSAKYRDAGIKTAADHQHCNNLCEWGPHVVKGGHCMVSPTSGTVNFEEVRFDSRYIPSENVIIEEPPAEEEKAPPAKN